MVVGAALVGGYLAAGSPGTDDSGPNGGGSAESSDADRVGFMRLEPEAFADRVARPSAFVVNVHIPYAGEIDGTDAFIAFDRIVGDSRLPADMDTEIVLYCRSGRMSEIAAEALVSAGYTNVVDLEGGMDAWRATGMPLRGAPPADTD